MSSKILIRRSLSLGVLCAIRFVRRELAGYLDELKEKHVPNLLISFTLIRLLQQQDLCNTTRFAARTNNLPFMSRLMLKRLFPACDQKSTGFAVPGPALGLNFCSRNRIFVFSKMDGGFDDWLSF